jgi:hypothetical protein
MKTTFFLAAILSLFTSSLFAQQEKVAQPILSTEEMAIKTVIENETEFFFQNKYDKWAECVAQDTMTYFTYISPYTSKKGIWEAKGWEEVSKSVKKTMKEKKPTGDYPAKSNYQFRINGNMAFVTFQEGSNLEGTRIMEKKNGQWRILRMEALNSKGFEKKHDLYALQRMAGNWEVDINTYTEEGGGEWILLSGQMTLERTPTGLISKETYHYKNNEGEPRTSEDVVVYSLDMESGKIGAFSSTFYPYSSWSTAHSGVAEIDDEGVLVGTGHRVGEENSGTVANWTMRLVGDTLHWSVSVKDKEGKEVYSNSCTYLNSDIDLVSKRGVTP